MLNTECWKYEGKDEPFELHVLTTHCDKTQDWYDTGARYSTELSAFLMGDAIFEAGFCSGFEIVKDTQVIYRDVERRH